MDLNSHTMDQEKQIDEKFLKNNLTSNLYDQSIICAAVATDHLLKSNLNKLIEDLNVNDFQALESANKQHINIYYETWSSYEKLRLAFTLVGDQNHWIACCLYVTYHKITIINKMNHLCNKNQLKETEQEQPCLSLVNLLSLSNLNLTNFLKKIKKLNDILNIPTELCYRIDQLELNYNVSCVLFSKYKLIFSTIFNCYPSTIHLSEQKQRTFIITNDLFNFGWLLFINIRVKFTQLSNDLVNSYHLLLCCINLLYLNLIKKTTDDQELKHYKNVLIIIKTDNLIDYLCKQFDGQTIEAKTINEHYFKPQLKILIIDKLIFGFKTIQYNDLIDLKRRLKFKRVIDRLNKHYDQFIKQNSVTKCNILNCLDSIYTYDIDERLFIDRLEQFNDVKLINLDPDGDEDDETDSHNNSLIIFESDNQICLDKLKLPCCLLILNNLSLSDLKLSLNCKFQVDCFRSVEQLAADLKGNILNEYNLKQIFNDSTENGSQHLRKKRKIDKSFSFGSKNQQIENVIRIIDRLFELVLVFFFKTVETMLTAEKQRIGSEQFKDRLNKLITNETMLNSIYICCFEIVYNFCSITTAPISFLNMDEQCGTKNESIKLSQYLQLVTTYDLKEKFKFPHSLRLSQTKEYDFFQIIELFIKSTTMTTNSQLLESTTPLIDRDIVKYLNTIEETVLESLAWQLDSLIWSKLKLLKLNENYLNTFQSNCNNMHLLVPFPIYDDVFVNSAQLQTPSSQQSTNSILNAAVTNTSDMILNLTPNPQSSGNSFQSPSKYPTITRVVCNDSKTNNQFVSTKQIQVLSLNKTVHKQQRLNNLNSSLSFFFRKFYNLTNLRLKDLIDRLDLVALSMEAYNSTIKQEPQLPTPHTTPNQNYQNQQLSNEFQQAILKKIWSIFEYSICINQQLMQNRHLDQVLLCSVYITCRLYSFTIQFNDIINAYRLLYPLKSSIFRNVLIDSTKHSDLISFYNEIFIKVIKPFLSDSIQTPQLLLTDTNSNKKLIMASPAFLSPVVPKMQPNSNNAITQFSPFKIVDNLSLFVSPIKQTQTSCQTFQQHRNKLQFSFKDLNPIKSLRSINEMIKKNEVKIKPNNKRLFNDISIVSLSNSNTAQPQTSAVTQLNSLKNIKIEDETDGKLMKQNMNKNYLSTVVGSRLGFTSTMVINSSSSGSTTSSSFPNTTSVVTSSIVGTNFARKLQNIQTERLN